MQTEEKANAEEIPEAVPPVEKHWHLMTVKGGEEVQNFIISTDDPADTVSALHAIVHRGYDASLDFLTGLSLKEGVDPTRVGEQHLRTMRLKDLRDIFDPKLFEHELFGQPATRDCLAEAFEIAMDCVGSIEISAALRSQLYLCEEECPQRDEMGAQEAEIREGSATADRLITDAGDALKNALRAAGFDPVCIEMDIRVGQTVADLTDPSVTEQYINADRPENLQQDDADQ